MQNNDRSELSVTYRSVDTLIPHFSNARIHSKRQINQIATSIRTFGFANPVLIDRHDAIIAGHGRVSAAKLIGMDKVPTIQLEHLTEDQIRAYVIADNRIAEAAGWDNSILAIELQHLMTVNLDASIVGFENSEIDLIMQDATASNDKDDLFEVDQANPAVTQFGDLWLLGKHRILCGNSLDKCSFKALMGSRKANVVFLDPPYNIPIQGYASGHGKTHYREFVMAASEMSNAEFVTFLTTSLGLAARHSTVGSVHFICMDWRHMHQLLAAGEEAYDSLLNVCVWIKNSGGLGSFYKSRHELVFVFRNGKGRHRNNIQLGRFGRDRTNVWEYSRVSSLSREGDDTKLLALHPTVKPVALVADALLDCSARGDIVLDSFLGSGSTLIASERVGRTCFGIEIDPMYVDGAIRRWQEHTGDRAIQSSSGKYFDGLAALSEVGRG